MAYQRTSGFCLVLATLVAQSFQCDLPLWPHNFTVNPMGNDPQKPEPRGVLDEKVLLCDKNAECDQVLYLPPSQLVPIWKALSSVDATDSGYWWKIAGHKRAGYVEISTGASCFCWLSGKFQVSSLCGCGFMPSSAMEVSHSGTSDPFMGVNFKVVPEGSHKVVYELWATSCHTYLEMQDKFGCAGTPMPFYNFCNKQSSCPPGSKIQTSSTTGCTLSSCTNMACEIGSATTTTVTTTGVMSTTTTTTRATTVTTTTRATTATTTGTTGNCNKIWGQCGGKHWAGPTCCIPGTTCTKVTSDYSQCKPSLPEKCVKFQGQCGGVNWTGPTNCCVQSEYCHYFNLAYSGCRSKHDKSPKGDDESGSAIGDIHV